MKRIRTQAGLAFVCSLPLTIALQVLLERSGNSDRPGVWYTVYCAVAYSSVIALIVGAVLVLRRRLVRKRADQRVAKGIREYGWHCLHVFPRVGEEGVNFSYTIGLAQTYGHPELMIFGLEREKARRILWECANMIKEGTRFAVEQRVPDVLAREFDVSCRPVRKEHFGDYLGTAVRYYGGREFAAYVLFWPDKDNKFPWESGELSSQGEAMQIVAR